MGPRIAFITGKLAAPALRAMLDELAPKVPFEPAVVVQKISVAALMTVDWLAGKVALPEGATKVVLPGSVAGDPKRLADELGVPVERGPQDFRDLPDYFSHPAPVDYGDHALEILAEINAADRLSVDEIVVAAERFRRQGADVIDLGATPSAPWPEVGAAVRELTGRGIRVSIDSWDLPVVRAAVEAGATLVLSASSVNREELADLGAEFVVVPDRIGEPGADWRASLAATAGFFAKRGVKHRLDPILEPIGFGFAASLERYLAARREFPETPILMGVGNLTELTEVDSAGINALLAGFCAELRIESVLTTAVINWAQSSVIELDVARRLMHHAAVKRRLPKRVDPRLVCLRDPKRRVRAPGDLEALQASLKDPNFRLFADGTELVAMNAAGLERDADAFRLFERLGVTDPAHAFYLGWELQKAALAIQLGKEYVQDQALRWGHLTREEESHRGRGKEEAPD
jgi:dihydropteroate synthase